MSISYKRLWKLLIDKDMKKKDLEQKAGISHYTLYKLYHGENVTTDVLARICKALDCTMDDILEMDFSEPVLCEGEGQKNGI